MRILVVEDEPMLAHSISEGLRLDGYEVDTSDDGNIALDLCLSGSYDLILLDLNLPGMDGLEVLHELRKTDLLTPVLILSSRIQLADKLHGFDEGANDYLTKPFHFEELEARIRSLTRRRFIQESVVLSAGSLQFNTITRETSVHGHSIHLTKKESGILEYLLLHSGCYISQEDLIDHIWDGSAEEFSNSIRVHMSSLRKKLRNALGYDPISNKIGHGYIIKQENEYA